jgi:hypothetical protein
VPVIVADMVLKPKLNDVTTLGCVALVLTTGIALASVERAGWCPA